MRLPAPLLALALLGFSRLAAQEFVPLDFSQNVQATNALYPNNSILGPAYYSGTTFDFINVATVNGQSIDARFSVTSVAPNYEFEGWIPAYNGPIISNSNFGYPDNRQPSDQGDDVGIYYHSVHSPVETTGHLSVKLEFFTGGGNFNSLIMLDSIALMLYDHDGEPGQSESIRAHLNDGLQGYSIRNDSGITRPNGRRFHHFQLRRFQSFRAYLRRRIHPPLQQCQFRAVGFSCPHIALACSRQQRHFPRPGRQSQLGKPC